MNRIFKTLIFVISLCSVSLLFVSCGDGDDGDTSGNAQNGVITQEDSDGGVVSQVISGGEDVVSRVEDDVSEFFSDIMPDSSFVSDESIDENVSFSSEGEVSEL